MESTVNMKSILITGANGGMGKKTAELFARSGFCVYALDISPVDRAENVIPLCVDITDEQSVRAAYGKVKETAHGICGIIHLAGVYALDSLAEMEYAAFERAFRINVNGAFLVNKTFLPLLGEGARIIMVTSELAVRDPLPFTGIYSVTKTALDKYAYALRMELQLLGIHVSVLRAGAVDTGMLGDSTRQLDRFCAETKLYKCNAARFKAIVDKVESRKIPPE
ncbi:MAG: SDR family oxidoreductase, partial [Clostridia bacterium]|nr:SDR family oxidoreductase [Clostridia bacterium]